MKVVEIEQFKKAKERFIDLSCPNKHSDQKLIEAMRLLVELVSDVNGEYDEDDIDGFIDSFNIHIDEVEKRLNK